MQGVKFEWEERSKKYGNRMEGVLIKSLPRPVNDYIHNWMLNQIIKITPKRKEIKILDLGCGYGRLSKPLLKQFPKCSITGIDIAKTYVELYNKELSPNGKALLGDIRKLPFKSDNFDLVFIVTTLMYLTLKSDQEKAISEIFRVLKPSGKFVIIERNPQGHNFLTLGGIINKVRGDKNKEISAVGFTKQHLSKVIEYNGGRIIDISGVPMWTLLLPISYILSLINKNMGEFFLRFIDYFDKKMEHILTLSLYISYTGIKKQ